MSATGSAVPLRLLRGKPRCRIPDSVTALTVSVPKFLIAPPFELLSPLLIVKPEMLVVTLGSKILKILNKGVPGAALRWTVKRFAPGPWNVRLFVSSSSPEVNVIGLVTLPALMSKVMVEPAHASIIA